MDYTTSPDFDTVSGKRLHKDSGPIDTVWSAKDANQIIWSLMKLLEDAGVSAASFDPADSATYDRVSLAVAKRAAVRTTFTPVLKFGGGNTGMTFSSSSGRLIQVGDMVTFWYFVQLSAKGSSTGVATFELPGAPDNPAASNVPAALNGMATTLPGDGYGFLLAPGTVAMGELRAFNPAAGSFIQLNDTHFTNASAVYLTGSYLVS